MTTTNGHKIPLSDIIDFNPVTHTISGQNTPFVDMAGLPTTNKYIPIFGNKPFSGGGAKFKDGDTLFARITPCLENNKGAFVRGLGENISGHGSTEFIVFRAKQKFDSEFVYYISRLPEFRAYAKQHMFGTSGRQRVSWQSLAKYEIPYIKKQDRIIIGSILQSFDEKIDINRRMNETLEAIAQAIFRDWFVDFGPTRAKMAGHAPYLASDIWDLFPDKLDKQGNPQGWEIKRLDEICESITSGGTPARKTDSYWTEGTIPWFKTGELNDGYLINSKEHITANGLDNSSSKSWQPGTILFALYASPTVGRLGILTIPATANQAAAGIVAKKNLWHRIFKASFICRPLPIATHCGRCGATKHKS